MIYPSAQLVQQTASTLPSMESLTDSLLSCFSLSMSNVNPT